MSSCGCGVTLLLVELALQWFEASLSKLFHLLASIRVAFEVGAKTLTLTNVLEVNGLLPMLMTISAIQPMGCHQTLSVLDALMVTFR